MQKFLFIVFTLFSLPSFALEGFHFEHKDWEIACDNTGTCRMAGYNEYNEYDSSIEGYKVSFYFERKAGENSILGKVKTEKYEFYSGDESITLWLDNQSLGTLQRSQDREYYPLTENQTMSLLAALTKTPNIEVHSPSLGILKLSADGATAVMLKMDEFQQRLDTPSALVRKGLSKKTILAPQPIPILQSVKSLSTEYVKHNSPRYTKLLSLLASQPASDDCAVFGDERFGGITVNQLSENRKLIGTRCYYDGVNEEYPEELLLLTDLAEKEVFWSSNKYYSDYHAGNLSSYHKQSRSRDCFDYIEALWNGEQIVRSNEFTTGMCRGFSGGAWKLPTLVSTKISETGEILDDH